MENQLMSVEQVITKLVSRKGSQIIFDASEYTIVKSIAGNSVEGLYLGRWSDFKKAYDLVQNMKGDGYMILSEMGEVYMLPEWESLARKFEQVKPGDVLTIVISSVEPTANGGTYVKCGVVRTSQLD